MRRVSCWRYLLPPSEKVLLGKIIEQEPCLDAVENIITSTFGFDASHNLSHAATEKSPAVVGQAFLNADCLITEC
jgi:hypothetical protein